MHAQSGLCGNAGGSYWHCGEARGHPSDELRTETDGGYQTNLHLTESDCEGLSTLYNWALTLDEKGGAWQGEFHGMAWADGAKEVSDIGQFCTI